MRHEDRFDIVYKTTRGMGLNKTFVLVDRETGVNYLFMQNGYAGGMTPLLDADGKPIVTKERQQGRMAL